jgi:RimJ/RimL family protein N-acetyltransferase
MDTSRTIITSRLVLRPVRREDGPLLLALISNWNVAQWLSTVPWPYGAEDMTEFLETIALPRTDGPKPIFAMEREGQPIGVIECIAQPESNVSPGTDLGYWIGEPHWGNGYATEAAAALVEHAFAQPAADMIRSGVFEGNVASLHVQQKLGFEVVGEVMANCRPRGQQVRLIRTLLTRAQFRHPRQNRYQA